MRELGGGDAVIVETDDGDVDVILGRVHVIVGCYIEGILGLEIYASFMEGLPGKVGNFPSGGTWPENGFEGFIVSEQRDGRLCTIGSREGGEVVDISCKCKQVDGSEVDHDGDNQKYDIFKRTYIRYGFKCLTFGKKNSMMSMRGMP
jgi:hypothetical protein